MVPEIRASRVVVGSIIKRRGPGRARHVGPRGEWCWWWGRGAWNPELALCSGPGRLERNSVPGQERLTAGWGWSSYI